MINLGVIGTNWISHQFVQAAIATEQYRFAAVYSRKLETAQQFASDYPGDVICETDLARFLASPEIDVVYIASPNSLHFSQAQEALLAGKHVIVEKPAFSTPREMTRIIDLAKERQVLFFEAARNLHEQSFQTVKQTISNAENVIGANFTYMKYSSRYDQVKAGEEPNIFSPRFSGGSLSDLGVYPIYAAIGWFGKPQSVHHFARKIVTGVDGIGTAILRYATFDVTISHGKINDSNLPSEIYFDNGTLFLNGINAIEKAVLTLRGKEPLALPVEAKANPMIEEAINFAEVIQQPDTSENHRRYQEWLTLTQEVNTVLFELRQQEDIQFTADQEWRGTTT